MADRGRVKVEPGQKRVRAVLAGTVIADTSRTLLVWEIPNYPAYYLPVRDIRSDVLVASDHVEHSPSRGDARFFHIQVGDRVALNAARQYPDSPIEELRAAVKIDWDAMDAWFEEDVEVYVHPRSPYTRVDVLASSRHVQVEVDGVTVADSRTPVLLFETGLPVRYYLPKTDVRMDLLTAAPTTSRCPYKGIAEYYSLTVGATTYDDFVWWYRHPAHESIGIAGHVAFYNERVDLIIDGERQDRPRTKFA